MRFRTVLLALVLEVASAQAGDAGALELVDINHATVEQLLHVNGMTLPWAKRIVRFRPYRTKLDLLDEGIVSAAVYRRIRDRIVAHRSDSRAQG